MVDKKRHKIKIVEVPLNEKMQDEVNRNPGMVIKTYMIGQCRALLQYHPQKGYHLSVSRKDRPPNMAEIKRARYGLIPDGVMMMLLLLPLNFKGHINPLVCHLYQIDFEE